MSAYIYGQEDKQPLEGLLRHFSVALPDIPYEVALDLVRQRYIELCRRSGILEEWFELPIQKGVQNYFLSAPEGYEIFKITGVSGNTPKVWSGPSVNYWWSYWGYNFTILDNKEIVFDREPSRDETGRFIKFSLIPNDCVTDIPTSIATPYGRGIADGAIGTALLMPGKAWTNPALAQAYERKFNIAVMAAKNLMLTERGSKPAEFRPVRIL